MQVLLQALRYFHIGHEVSVLYVRSLIVSKSCYHVYSHTLICTEYPMENRWSENLILQGGVKLMQFNFLGNWLAFQLAVKGTVEIGKIICFWEIDEFLTEKSPHIINWLLGYLYPHLDPCPVTLFCMKASLFLLPLLYEVMFASVVYLIASRVLFAYVTGQNYIH